MYLTSVTKLKLNKEQFKVIDTMSYRAKALYNSSLYEINKHFQDTKEYLNYNSTDLLMKNHTENTVYRSLPSALSQQLIKKLHKDYSSFFALLKKKQNKDYDKQINKPRYKSKDSGKELIFTKSKTSTTFIFKDGWIYITVPEDLHKGRLKLCKVPEYLKNKDFQDEIKYMEIIPKLDYYELHIKYEEEAKTPNNLNSNWCSIDLGLNNLCTVTSNAHKPYLINGRAIKSINQKYNKRIAKLTHETKKSQNANTSKEIKRLFSKRGDKLNNEIHKISDFIVKSVLEKKIDYVVIGYNKEWKQNINIGKRNNQNFVQIPFNQLFQQLSYRSKEIGIKYIETSEEYTSKCSSIDNEIIGFKDSYDGMRIKRGLFKTKNNLYINADVNGSINILRKATGIGILPDQINGILVYPLKIRVL